MNVHFSSDKHNWGTPQFFFDYLDEIFSFDLDPCAEESNAKCKDYYTIKEDGLSKSWEGKRVFMNPPYGRELPKWMKKASEEGIVVCLVPARTDTAWFHDYVIPLASLVYFVKGRIRFEGADHSAPFPSMVVIYGLGIKLEFGTLDLHLIREYMSDDNIRFKRLLSGTELANSNENDERED